MSNIYIQEPPTNGKVCLKCSVGDIDIELWSKECPKACRNFVQLCMEGYYDGTIFHRLVPEFIVQGGDPTGSGMGGESIYGKPFKDEFHSRLRFMRRGLVAMANSGSNDNGSQFFFTLGATQELQSKHTLFGKVVGDTLFNMLKLGESETDQNEKPLEPHKIISTKILTNPFEDMVPRVVPKRDRKKDKDKDRFSAKATKNFNLLSFGAEAEEDDEESDSLNKKFSGKSKSAHDVLEDERLSTLPAVDSHELGNAQDNADAETSQESEGMKERIREKLKSKRKIREEGEVKEKKERKEEGEEEEEEDMETFMETQLSQQEKQKMENLKAEFKQLQKDVAKSKRKQEEKPEARTEEKEETEAIAAYHAERDKYVEIKKQLPKPKSASREAQTLEILAKFRSKLQSVSSNVKEDEKQASSGEDEDDGEDDVQGDDWMGHKLRGAEPELKQAKDANVKTDDTFDIYDPRNPMNKRRREESQKHQRKHRHK